MNTGYVGHRQQDSHNDAQTTLPSLLRAQRVLVDDAVDTQEQGRPRNEAVLFGHDKDESRMLLLGACL